MTKGKIKKWGVVLDGEAPDKATWAQALPQGSDTWMETRELKGDAKNLLRSTEFDGIETDVRVLEKADDLVARTYGSLRIDDENVRPLETTGELFRVDEDGTESWPNVVGMGTAQFGMTAQPFTVTVTGPDGRIIPEEPKQTPAQARVIDSYGDEHRGELLRLLAKRNSWIALYMAYDLMKSGVGGKKKLAGLGKISVSKLGLFSQTCQMHRHHSKKFTPPPKPMPYHEALSLVLNLANAYLNSLQKAV